ERKFQNGIVVVNPTNNSVSTFSLGGGTYSGSGLTNVKSVSMGATSGYILLATSIPAPVAPANTSAPTIAGSPNVGNNLTASPGTWTGSPAPTYSYQWKRCTTTSLTSCTAISGATASTYTVQSADVRYYIDVAVKG